MNLNLFIKLIVLIKFLLDLNPSDTHSFLLNGCIQ